MLDLGLNTSSNQLQKVLDAVIMEPSKIKERFLRLCYLPHAALVPDVKLKRSANMTFVHEGTTNKLVEESSFQFHH